MAIVTFDPAEFRELYPSPPHVFGAATDAQMRHAFDTAALFVDNTERSRIPYDPDKDVETRKILLYALTCHLLTLAFRGAFVGNLTNATEGSVSAGFSLPAISQNAAWFAQTPCGLTFWQLWQKYTLGGRYVRYCQR